MLTCKFLCFHFHKNNENTNTASIPLSSMMYWWNVKLTSASDLTSMSYYWDWRTRNMHVSVVAAFFCFCLDVLAAKGYSSASVKGCYAPA